MRPAALAAATAAVLAGTPTSPAAAATLTAAATSPALAAQMRVIDLGTLSGQCCSDASAINDQGQVVGGSSGHAFRWQRGRMADLGTLGGEYSGANGINERGDAVVGWSQVKPGDFDTTHAFLWRAGRMIDLGTLGGSRSYATGVNDRHEVAGFSETANGILHAFVWRHGRMKDLTQNGTTSTATAINNRGLVVGEVRAEMDSVPVLWGRRGRKDLPIPAGEFGANAQAINDKGDVAGHSFGPAGNSAFLWRHGRVTPLGTLPGSIGARALGINNRGQVVGNTDFNAFLWQRGRMTALPSLVSTSSATDINNRGQVVGSSATTAEGTNAHAVLWTRRTGLVRAASLAPAGGSSLLTRIGR